jgi:hypothetical protein
MITAIIRKPTPTMKTIHADNKKTALRENQSVVYDARQHFIRKTHFSPISCRECAKRKIKDT